MNVLIVDTDQQATLSELNSMGDPTRQLNAVELTDGRKVLNADLLNDCSLGQTWSHYGDFLATLAVAEIDLALLAQEPTPEPAP